MQALEPMNRQINHKTMRVIVGIIAVLLAPVVWLLSDSKDGLTSISISYWTDSHDVFVGSLMVVGFFLSAYNGSGNGKDWTYFVSKAACIFAICVAIFPTEGFSAANIPAMWVQTFSEFFGMTPKIIHYITAILFFACLIALMWSFSIRAIKKSSPLRAYFYRGVSIFMVLGMVVIYFIGNALLLKDTLYWVELWGLMLFGFGWLAAGMYRSNN